MSYEALYYDGKVSTAHNVRVALNPDRLLVTSIMQDSEYARPAFQLAWPYDTIAMFGNPKDGLPMRVGIEGEVARLHIESKPLWDGLYPKLHASGGHGFHIPASATLIAALFCISLFIMVGAYVSVPYMSSALAPYLSDGIKSSLSDTVVDTMFASMPECNNSDGLEALALLQKRIVSGSGVEYPHPFRVIEHPAANAFTLPDDRIYIFSGLLTKASSQEEVAGVLAHELGHVIHSHPAEGVVQSLGGQFLVLLMTGGGSSTFDGRQIFQAVLQSGYQRDMEREADQSAIALMDQAHLDPDGLVTFFDTMRKESGGSLGVLDYVSTHPSNEERIDTMKKLISNNGDRATFYQSALNAQQWQALQNICKK